MSSTADPVRQEEGLAQQAHVVLSQADQARARAIRAMKSSAGIEDRVAAVMAVLARQRSPDADRLMALSGQARQQARRCRDWVTDHSRAGEERAAAEQRVLAQADRVRARGVRVMEAVATTWDEVAAVLAELARQRPGDADRLMALSGQARQQALRCRAWVKEHPGGLGLPGPGDHEWSSGAMRSRVRSNSPGPGWG